ncbi:hypothetical protein GVAV_001539 [Gurleya vavrai]
MKILYFVSIFNLVILKSLGVLDPNNSNKETYVLKELFIKQHDLINRYLDLTNENSSDSQSKESTEQNKHKSSTNIQKIEYNIQKVHYELETLYEEIRKFAFDYKNFDLCLDYSKKLISFFKCDIFSALFQEILTVPNKFYKVNRTLNFHYENTNITKIELLDKENDSVDNLIEISNYIKGFYDDEFEKFTIDHKFFLDVLTIFLRQKETLDIKNLLLILKIGYKKLLELENVVYIDTLDNVYVFGDTHGQFFDTFGVLINIEGNGLSFKTGFKLDTNKIYIFNGDFVDRGKYSIENYTFLLLLKILYPKNIFLNRGNHEFIDLNIRYGFYKEIKQKYGIESEKIKSSQMYKNLNELQYILTAFNLTFSVLPLATIINRKVFVVHGGLPEENLTIDQIQKLDRKTFQYSINESFDGLMWSDPYNKNDKSKNINRGIGFIFESNITERFLYENGLSVIARSHQDVEGGVEKNHDEQVITVFSAPNYCGTKNNKAAYLIFKTNNEEGDFRVCEGLFYNFKQFNEWPKENLELLN